MPTECLTCNSKLPPKGWNIHDAFALTSHCSECQHWNGMHEPWCPDAVCQDCGHKQSEHRKMLWWFSFSRDGKFAGAIVVRSHGPWAGLKMTHDLKLNPGGDVKCVCPQNQRIGDEWLDRLLNREEVILLGAQREIS